MRTGQRVPANLGSNTAKALSAILSRRLIIECDRIPFRFDHVPLSKIINWILIETSIYIRSKAPWGYPTHVQVEPTNCCNLRCALCPITNGMDRASGMMKPDLFRKLVDEAGRWIFLMMLWDWGEPFLNPAIYEMISYARQRGIKILSSTNGHFFRSREQALQLVRSGIDSIIVAVDGISQETYQRYRELGNLTTVTDGIRSIVAAKKELHSKTPLINFRFVVMKHNEHEVPGLREFARSLGVDMLSLRALHPHDAEGLLKGSQDARQFMPANPHYLRYKAASDGIRLKPRNHNPCRKLWNSATLHWNGIMCPCCFDPHDRHVLGDLTKTDFSNIWKGQAYREMRCAFRIDYRRVAMCADCTYAYEGGALSTEDFIDAHFFHGQ